MLMALVHACACDRASKAADHESHPDAGPDDESPAIGAACDRQDGWQPRQPVPDAGELADGGLPDNNVPDGYVDYQDLPTGIGWCLTNNQDYPYGYFTMNCKNDDDCPSSAKCDDGMMCRAPCGSDRDCRAPMKCLPHGSAVLKFCECPDCVAKGMGQ